MAELEHSTLIGELAARFYNAAPPLPGTDLIDVIREFGPKISQLRDEAIAAELERHASLMWDTGKMLEATHAVLVANGDDQAAAIIDGQKRLLNDMSTKLKQRAGLLRPVADDERAMLTVTQFDGTVLTFPEAAEPITPTLDDGTLVFGVLDPGSAAPDAAVVILTCAVCGNSQAVPDFDEALAWRNGHPKECPGPPKELPAD